MTRPYRLGKRGDAMARTREAIVRAAVHAYAARGIQETSMQEVARRADVSPATVLHHFARPEDLARAALEQVRSSLHVPTPAEFEHITGTGERIERFATLMSEFYARSEPWYGIYVAERDYPPLVEAQTRFYHDLKALTRAALGPIGSDEGVLSAVLAITDPAVFGRLREEGLTPARAGVVIGEILAPWIAQKADRAGAHDNQEI